MKSCGKAILQVPISKNSLITFEDNSITEPKERELNFGQFDHVRIYGQDYIKRLEESGFKVERINISKKKELIYIKKERKRKINTIPITRIV